MNTEAPEEKAPATLPQKTEKTGTPAEKLPTKPVAPPKPNPVWWRYGAVPYIVLLLAAAAADCLCFGTETGGGLKGAIGAVAGIGALLMLRKDFRLSEIVFLVLLMTAGAAALWASASGFAWAMIVFAPFILLRLPSRHVQKEDYPKSRSWWAFWLSRSEGEKRSRLRAVVPTLLCLLAGVVAFIFFLTIFASGNPVVQQVWQVIVETWNNLTAYLRIGTDFWLHVFLWVLGMTVFGFYTRSRVSVLPIPNRPAKPFEPGKGRLPILMPCILVGVNLAFLIATSTDVAFLWFRRVPEGISQTKYLYNGAESITWASILSAVLLLFAFRGRGSARYSVFQRICGYALLIQTLVLAVSVFLRLYYQVGSYGFTPNRILAGECLLGGAFGLVLLFFYMSGQFRLWHYVRIGIAGAVLLAVTAHILPNGWIAGELNLRCAPSHPNWNFEASDFGGGRHYTGAFRPFGVEDHIGFTDYVAKKSKPSSLDRELWDACTRYVYSYKREHSGFSTSWLYRSNRDTALRIVDDIGKRVDAAEADAEKARPEAEAKHQTEETAAAGEVSSDSPVPAQ